MSYNVNRNVTDAFYRYKMPKIMAKVEGKGNGIKTVIVNMGDVAKALGRPPTYPCKYFGCELGAQTQFDYKNDRYIVNGSHDASKLQTLLDGFIKRFVLCPECENPETDLLPNERKGIIKQTCKACGHFCQLDMRHKLTTYILKNPPDVKPDHQGTSLTKGKDRRKRGDKNSLRPDSQKQGGSDASDNDQNGESEGQEINWGGATTEEAIKERQKDLSAGVRSLTISNDVDKPLVERIEIFYNYIKEKKDEGVLKPGATTAVLKDISSEAERLEIKDSKGVMALVDALLDENILKQVIQYNKLFRLFTDSNPKTQKYLLGAVEKLIECKKNQLLPKVSHILKVLYDHDIVEEEVLLEWSKKGSKKYVSKETSQEIHAKAAVFIKWLQEAEEEESTEEEDAEDDLEIEYDDKARVTTLKEQEAKSAPANNAPAVAENLNAQEEEEDSEEEIDIDNL